MSWSRMFAVINNICFFQRIMNEYFVIETISYEWDSKYSDKKDNAIDLEILKKYND